MVYIGDISYVLYLVHWPVYIIMNNFKSSIYGAYPIGILVSFVAAATICEYFEKVYLQWQPSSTALLLIFTIATTAYLVFRPPSSGYPFTDEPFHYKGVNLSDASWNHTLMQHIAYSEGVRVRALRRNFVTPGCKYSERFVGKNLVPFGLCQLKQGQGNLSVLVIGNSFACNQADMVYKAFRRKSSSFHVFCLSACEVLSLSASTICKVRVNYTEIVEKLRPNVVFILDRYISSKRVPKGDLADNLDVTLMQQVYNLMNIERLADKVFILQALPSCLRSCVTTALDFMIWKNKPLRDIGTKLIVVDDELARTHLDELRKMCMKCELIDYLPALVNDDGIYRGYDNETNLLYLDNNNHLTRFGKERVQPIFDEIASRLEL